MPRRVFGAGEYYHIYNRGNARELIFFEPENYRFFLARLRKYFVPEFADIVAYCLMPNHYHLLVFLRQDNLGKIMHPLGMSYAKAINTRYQRVGHLFQGPFQSRRVETTAQLLHLSRYIHLNPVHARLVPRPKEWEYSSYLEFIGERLGTLPKPEVVLEHFSGIQAYASFVEDGLEKDDACIETLLLD